MLLNIDPVLSPSLLYTLRAMGHGDTIVIADANFPAESTADNCIRLDGLSAGRVLSAVLSVMPLDTFIDDPAKSMQIVGDSDTLPEAVVEFQQIINDTADAPRAIQSMERFAFYEEAKKAVAVIQTGETRAYGNIILTKGVVL